LLYNTVTLFSFERGSCSVGQSGLKLMILLSLPSGNWSYRSETPCLAFAIILISLQ
jgi:hypothetical protein